MLRFFRINDPYRLIVVLLVLLLLRLPIFIAGGDNLTVPELDYLLVGEKFNEGKHLYSEIWTRLGPLSAIFYGVLNFLFGKSQLALQIVALLIIFFQSFIFNKVMLMHKAFDENTYVPCMIYALLMSWFFDQFSLSPALLGLTFILLAMNNLFAHLEFKAKKDEVIHNIGLHIGVACLFYLPYVIVVPFVILAIILFSSTVIRRYLLVLYGFLLPILLATVVFMLTGRLGEFVLQFFMPAFGTDDLQFYMDRTDILIIFSVPILFFALGLLTVLQRGRFSVFQANLSQFMVIWMLFNVAYVFIVQRVVPANLVLFVPPMAYYLSQYFLNIRRRWLAEIVFVLLFVAAVFFNHGIVYGFSPVAGFVDTSRYFIAESDKDPALANKRILVLGPDIRAYTNAKSATPFLEWQLSREVFLQPRYYDNMRIIGEGLSGDMPEVIVDQQDLMPELKKYFPVLREFRSAGNDLYLRPD